MSQSEGGSRNRSRSFLAATATTTTTTTAADVPLTERAKIAKLQQTLPQKMEEQDDVEENNVSPTHFSTLPVEANATNNKNAADHEEEDAGATTTTIVRYDVPDSSTYQITPSEEFFDPSSSSSMVIGIDTLFQESSSIEQSSSGYIALSSEWSFSPMRFTGVALFITMLASYLLVLRLARKHRVKIAYGQVLSMQMMQEMKFKKLEQEMADLQREEQEATTAAAATANHRLEFINLKTASRRSSFIFRQPAPGSLSPLYRQFFPCPTIPEQHQQESCTTFFSSRSMSTRNPSASCRSVQKGNVDEDKKEKPSNEKKRLVQIDPWMCQNYEFSPSQLQSPLSIVSDTEVATNTNADNRSSSSIKSTLPLLVAFSNPSSSARKKALVLNSVYVPGRQIHHDDIQLPPLAPPPPPREEEQEQESSKALSFRSIYPVETMSPSPTTTRRRRLSSFSRLKEADEHGNESSSSHVAPCSNQNRRSPVDVPNTSPTNPVSVSSSEEGEFMSCHLDNHDDFFRAGTPPSSLESSPSSSKDSISPRTDSPSARLPLVHTTDLFTQPDGVFRHCPQPDTSSTTTIYAMQPIKRRSAKKRLEPPSLCGAPPPLPEHFL
jgi:hypothetical protein